MNRRQEEALRYPCETAEQTFQDRYRRTVGDVHTILTVSRYQDINDGQPVWHASVDLRDRSRVARERETWNRRDRRTVEKALRDLLRGIGVETEEVRDPPRLDQQHAEHRLRPLTERETRLLRLHYRLHARAL